MGENNIKSHCELYHAEKKKKGLVIKKKKQKHQTEKKKSFHLALTYSKKTIMHILNQTLIQVYFAVFHKTTHTFTPCFLKTDKWKVKKCNCQRKVIYVQTLLEILVKGNSCM